MFFLTNLVLFFPQQNLSYRATKLLLDEGHQIYLIDERKSFTLIIILFSLLMVCHRASLKSL